MPPTPSELALDALVDRLLRGESCDVEAFLGAHPELAPAEIARVRKLARVLGRSPRGAAGLPFERLGPYRLLERLGAGGMGIVYLAEDERLGRRVALKLVRPELAASAETSARFEREARAVAKLAHEHIVTVFEAGRIDDVAYLAMELVPGKSLEELYAEARLTQTPLAARELLRWIRDVGRALAAAHAAGIVHRDVKPSNIRITPEKKALLVDFGLALAPDSATLSRSGEVQGTLYYISPEQLAARGPVDGRSDVWSLGVTLYEGVTGHRPFEGASAEEVLYQIVSREPLAPRALVPALARDLETVVLKALEKEPARRYASASELADELDCLLEGRPVRARPTGPVTRAWKWSRRKPVHALALGLGALVAVGGPLGFALVQGRHARALERERDRVEAERKIADEQRLIAEERTKDLERLTLFQAETIGNIQPLALGEELIALLEEELRQARLEAGASEEEAAAELETLARLVAGVSAADIGARTLRTQLLEPAIRRAREDFGARPKLQGMLLHSVAATAWSLGNAELALETQRAAYEILVASVPEDDRDRLVARANLGHYLQSAGRLKEAEPLMRAAAEDLARMHGEDDERTLNARHNVAMLLYSLGQMDDAIALETLVLERRKRVNGPASLEALSSLSSLGGLYYAAGRYAEAEPAMVAAYEGRLAALGPAHENTLTSANNLATLYHRLGRQADALRVQRQAYEGARTVLGDEHRTTQILRSNLGEILATAGEEEEAVALLRASVDGLRKSAGPLHGDTLLVSSKLVGALRQLGRAGEAVDEFEPARAAAAAELGADAIVLRPLTLALVRALRELEARDEALALVHGVLPTLRTELGPEDRVVQQWLALEISLLVESERLAEAEATLAAGRPTTPTAELAEAIGALEKAGAARAR